MKMYETAELWLKSLTALLPQTKPHFRHCIRGCVDLNVILIARSHTRTAWQSSSHRIQYSDLDILPIKTVNVIGEVQP
jgi:hypothetical protein